MKDKPEKDIGQAEVDHGPDCADDGEFQEPFQFLGFGAAEADADTLNNPDSFRRAER
jgi:hypothetical protein